MDDLSPSANQDSKLPFSAFSAVARTSAAVDPIQLFPSCSLVLPCLLSSHQLEADIEIEAETQEVSPGLRRGRNGKLRAILISSLSL